MVVPRAYKLYTEPERLAILAAATAERLSATDVNRRFGVKPVTYYSWRMRAGIKSATGRPPRRQADDSSTESSSSRESGPRAIVDPAASCEADLEAKSTSDSNTTS